MDRKVVSAGRTWKCRFQVRDFLAFRHNKVLHLVTVNRGAGDEVDCTVTHCKATGNLYRRTSDDVRLIASGVNCEDPLFSQAPDSAVLPRCHAIVDWAGKGELLPADYLASFWIKYEKRSRGH